MTFSDVHNGGANCRLERAVANTAVTAGGGGDATEINGGWIDRQSEKGIALSAKLGISFTTTLAAAATLSLAMNWQDATDAAGAGAADYGDVVPAKVVSTGGAGGSTNVATAEFDVDLGGARRFIRVQVTPDLSAASVDTAALFGTVALFGAQRGPMTKATVNTASPDAI